MLYIYGIGYLTTPLFLICRHYGTQCYAQLSW